MSNVNCKFIFQLFNRKKLQDVQLFSRRQIKIMLEKNQMLLISRLADVIIAYIFLLQLIEFKRKCLRYVTLKGWVGGSG